MKGDNLSIKIYSALQLSAAQIKASAEFNPFTDYLIEGVFAHFRVRATDLDTAEWAQKIAKQKLVVSCVNQQVDVIRLIDTGNQIWAIAHQFSDDPPSTPRFLDWFEEIRHPQAEYFLSHDWVSKATDDLVDAASDRFFPHGYDYSDTVD